MLWRALTAGRMPTQWQVLRSSSRGAIVFGAPLAAFSLLQAPRGDKLASVAGSAAGAASFPVLAAASMMAINAATLFLPPPFNVLARLGAVRLGIGLAGLVSGFILSAQVEDGVFRGVRQLGALDRRVRSLEMGFGFRDTVEAQAWRERALYELDSAFQPARSYLGREAALLHR